MTKKKGSKNLQICFIGNELYPADRGGIARLLRNMALHIVQTVAQAEVHILLPAGHLARIPALSNHLPERIRLWACPNAQDVARRLGAGTPSKLFGIGRHPQLYAEAASFMFGAMDIEASIQKTLTHIEIPDHLGYGNLILSARASGLAFQSAEIACRIHSAFSELLGHEPDYYATESWHAARIDMEAECLRLADRIIAPLPAIASIVSNDPTFPPGKSIEINFPAVLDATPAPLPIAEGLEPDFVFASRFQPFKRAELFIRGAVRFLDNTPGYSGKMRLMAYAFDPMYLAGLRMMVPRRHAQRIVFETDLREDERALRLKNAVVVQPSAYESLCLLSYEIGALQRPLLLASDCAAFADEPRWQDGKTCLFFDATPESLAETMQKARTWRPDRPVAFLADPVWMEQGRAPKNAPQQKTTGAVIIGPVSDTGAVAAIRALARNAPPEWSVHLYTIGIDLQDAFDDPSIRHHIADSSARQDLFLADLLDALDERCVCLATPAALPHPELLNAASGMGISTALTALSGLPGEVNCFAGKAATLALQDSRLAPCCLCLPKHEALRLLRRQGSARRIVANMVMALQTDDLNLIVAPRLWVGQPISPFSAGDDIRLHGTQLRRQHRQLLQVARLGMADRANATAFSLLAESPIDLQAADARGSTKPTPDHIDISLETGKNTILLRSAVPLEGHMLRCTIVPGPAAPNAPISLTVVATDMADKHSETQHISLDFKRHQILLCGPIYGNALLELSFETPAGAPPVSCSLRRIRRLSAA